MGQSMFGNLFLAQPIWAKTNFGQSSLGQSALANMVCVMVEPRRVGGPKGGPEGYHPSAGPPKISHFFLSSSRHNFHGPVKPWLSLGPPGLTQNDPSRSPNAHFVWNSALNRAQGGAREGARRVEARRVWARGGGEGQKIVLFFFLSCHKSLSFLPSLVELWSRFKAVTTQSARSGFVRPAQKERVRRRGSNAEDPTQGVQCPRGLSTHTDTQTHRHTDTHTHIHTYTQTHRHTDTQTHRHTDTDTQTHTFRHHIGQKWIRPKMDWPKMASAQNGQTTNHKFWPKMDWPKLPGQMDGQNWIGPSWPKLSMTVPAAPPMPSCANNTSCGSDRIRKATLLGHSAVQVQRVWCSTLRKRDERRHSTTLPEPLRRYNHHLSRDIASDSTSHADLAPMKKPMREGPRGRQPTHHQIFSRVAAKSSR